MYRIELNMGLPEFAILRAIDELSQKTPDFNQQDIAAYVGCHKNTVSKAVVRLMRSGQIKRTGSPRTGYRYQRI